MKLEQTQIIQIRTAFEKMQSREDLLNLLNEAKPLVYGERAVPFELKQLTWYSNPKLGSKRYKEFKIRKKSGADRSIHAPVKGLKALQKTLNIVLQCIFEPHHAATGFVPNKSIVDNAKLHAGNKYVYNIDLKDFFPSVEQARVWKCLQLKPFLLVDSGAEKKNLKELEDARFSILVRSDETKKTIRDQELTRLAYHGYRYNSGSWSIKLKAGGKIKYKIIKSQVNDHDGRIIVFKDQSEFDNIKELAIKEAAESGNDPDSTLDGILAGLIEYHQQKIYEKDDRRKIANIIAALCCTEMEVERMDPGKGEWIKVKRNVLPQGAPTSPMLTNIVCQRLDYLLTAVAKRFGLKYSRYADDITFSSMHNVYQADGDFIKELHRIIAEQGFHIKADKTRLQKEGYRQEVTGLLVNAKVNVQKRYIKQLRMWLYYWERYGYDQTYGYFTQQYFSDKNNIVKGKPNMTSVIGGKLDYLKMVKGESSTSYILLRDRFSDLIGKVVLLPRENTQLKPNNQIISNREQHISETLNLMFTKGLDSAMDFYKPATS